MLKYALAAVAAAALVAVAIVALPAATGPRQPPRILASADTAPAAGFVIHDAPPAAPVPVPETAAPPSPPVDLDAVMQRLRAGAASPDGAAPVAAPVAAPMAAPGAGPPPVPAPVAPPVAQPEPPPDPPPPSPRWNSVTGQGTRWKMARTGRGFTVTLDLGGGQVADVHVQPAFADLDFAAMNVRVDYLHDTILQNFSNQSDSYTFGRDGSVTRDR